MKRVLLFKERNNEKPALLWKSSLSSSLPPTSVRVILSLPPTSSRRLTSNGVWTLAKETELMEQAAGASQAEFFLLKGLIKGHLGSCRIV